MELEVLSLLATQEGDYRQWEEKFFAACKNYLDSGVRWDGLLSASKAYPDVVQAKAEYLLHVFAHEVGDKKFDVSLLKMKDCGELGTSFWNGDYLPGFDYRGDKLALIFGLQRGIQIDRFHQFLNTGSN